MKFFFKFRFMITLVYFYLLVLKAEDGELHASEEKNQELIPTRNGGTVDKEKSSDVEGPDFVS